MKLTGIKLIVAAFAFATLTLTVFGAQPAKLGTQDWQLVQIKGIRVGQTKAKLEFNAAQTRFTGNAGCNNISGSVAVIGKRIDFKNVASTKMFCGGQAGSIEREFINALKAATHYEQNGRTLELLQRNRSLLKFNASNLGRDDKDQRGATLENRKWVVESIPGMRTLRALPEAFVVFDQQKGSAGGNTSCNVFGGSYTTNRRDGIRITDVVSTMRACLEGEKMQVERNFLDGLRTANRYHIEGNRLTLFRGNKLLLTLRGERK